MISSLIHSASSFFFLCLSYQTLVSVTAVVTAAQALLKCPNKDRFTSIFDCILLVCSFTCVLFPCPPLVINNKPQSFCHSFQDLVLSCWSSCLLEALSLCSVPLSIALMCYLDVTSIIVYYRPHLSIKMSVFYFLPSSTCFKEQLRLFFKPDSNTQPKTVF